MVPFNFTAVDFETATADKMACQVGVVVVKNGVIVEKYSSLIRPPANKYSVYTIKIHHISPEHTQMCSSFDTVWRNIEKYFINTTIVAHNANFDREVLYKNLEYYGIPNSCIGHFDCTYSIYGLGLHDLCSEFGIDSSGHHDALFDAECCAKFYINHLNGVTLEKHKKQIHAAINEGYHERISGDVLKKDLTNADPGNPFYDKKIVITGVFTVGRTELANRLKSMGADIDTSISKRTDIVLIGSDPGPKKIEKIEKLLLDGCEIKKVYQRELSDMLDKH